MKKFFATVLACVMLMSALPLSALAASNRPEANYPGFRPGHKPGIVPEDYHFYYEEAQELDNAYVQKIYEVYEAAEDITQIVLPLPELEGLEQDCDEAQAILDDVNAGARMAAWFYRYDHIAETELYTQSIDFRTTLKTEKRSSDPLPRYTDECKITIRMPRHPYADEAIVVGYDEDEEPITATPEELRDDKIIEIAEKVDTDAPLYDQLLTIHDTIAGLGEYNYGALDNDNQDSKEFLYAHTSLGLLLTGTGVCESYVKAFKMVCDYLGLGPTVCLVSEGHMWNAIQIDGRWYGVDVTFDDQEWESGALFRYFLCIDPDIVDGDDEDHQVKEGYPSVDYADGYYQPRRLAAPAVTVTNEKSAILLEYEEVRGGDTYRVRRRQYTRGKWSSWTTLANLKGQLYYRDSKIQDGIDYQYEVTAWYGKLFYSAPGIKTVRHLAGPTFQLSNDGSGVKVSWTKIAGVSSYTVVRYPVKGTMVNMKAPTTVARGVTGSSFTDKKVKSNTPYAYAVQSGHKNGTSAITSLRVIYYLAAPTTTVSNGASGVTIKWNKVAGASKYYVFRYVYSGGKWTVAKKNGNPVAIKSTTGTSFTDKAAKSGTFYRYAVKASSSKAGSAYVQSASLYRLATPTVKAENGTKGMVVSWNKVAGAKQYVVYRRHLSGNKWSAWKQIKTYASKVTAFTDTTVKNGVYYRYTVKPVNGKHTGAFTSTGSVRRLTSLTAKLGRVSNGIKVSWSKNRFATSYVVYRSQYNRGRWSGWTPVKSTTGTSYVDRGARKGVYYRYAIMAKSGGHGSATISTGNYKR